MGKMEAGLEVHENPEGIKSDDPEKIHDSLHRQINEAKASVNSERENYYRVRQEQMEAEMHRNPRPDRSGYGEISTFQIKEAKKERNAEREKYYKAKADNQKKMTSFGSVTLYELNEIDKAKRKYNSGEKMSPREIETYKKTHSGTTLYEIKKLDELSKKKK